MQFGSFLRKINSQLQRVYSSNLFTKFFAGWSLLSFLVSFNTFFGKGYLVINSPSPCFPHFQNCKELFAAFELFPLPFSYRESIFFTILFSLIVLGTYFLYKQKYFYTHLILVFLFIVKLIIITSNYGSGNYDYYDLIIIFVFLLYPTRVDLLKLTFVVLYFLASTIKIHSGWILGTYFSSLYYGLPLVPNNLIPIATNIVILTQLVGCWFLLSTNKKISSYLIYFYIFFHLYSTILVGYRYPTTALLSLLVIFIIGETSKTPPDFTIKKKTIPFYIFLASLFVLQSIAYFIPGDQKLTLEGNNYGIYMFEANHQCISYLTPKNGPQQITSSYDSRSRCDPYVYMKRIQSNYCSTSTKGEINWVFDHSINGEGFKRIVSVENVCNLVYEPFTHNNWIETERTAETVGKAYKNLILTKEIPDNSILKAGEYIYSASLINSKPVKKTNLQILMEGNLSWLESFYWFLWFGSLLYMLIRLLKNTIKKKNT